MDEARIEDIGSGKGAAGTAAETQEGQAGAEAGAGMNNGGDDTIKTGFSDGQAQEGEEPSAEKAAAAEAQQEEARASEVAEKMDENTTKECESQTCERKAECEAAEVQVEDPPDAKHPQVAFDANTHEQCDVEIGDRAICYCKGNRVVLDIVEKHDNGVLVGINQSDSDFLKNTAQITPYDRIIFSVGDVYELAVKP